jgi:hypothetical protein
MVGGTSLCVTSLIWRGQCSAESCAELRAAPRPVGLEDLPLKVRAEGPAGELQEKRGFGFGGLSPPHQVTSPRDGEVRKIPR